ncbi:MAG: hypothetical protein AB1716_06060 [Planctomycetota bacterium]
MPQPAVAFRNIALRALLAAILLGALGYMPTMLQAGGAGLGGMLGGISIALVGSWAGSLPTALYLVRPPRQHPTGILAGLAVRFVVTIGLALGAWLTGIWPERPLLIWVGIAQFVLLAVDVLGLTALLKRAAKGME